MQDNKQPNNEVAGGSLKTDFVNDIPLAVQGTVPKSADDDYELDKIMRDVGKDIKEVGKKPAKPRWFSHDKKPKTDAKFSARPIDQVKPAPAAPRPTQPVQSSRSPSVSVKPLAKKQPKPPKDHSVPIGAILLAIVMAGVLSTAAYYAYR